MVRLNPLNLHTHEEIRGALDSGAQRLMLPMFTTRHDVAMFLELVGGEVPVSFLVETPQALVRMPNWLPLLSPGRDEVHIGLNDLSLGMGLNFLFEPLASRLLDPSAELLNAAGIAWGIGGVARVGQGELPAERVIGEHVRLGSRRVILSRAFHGGAASSAELLETLDFPAELAKLRQVEAEWRKADIAAPLDNQSELGRCAYRLAFKLDTQTSPAPAPMAKPATAEGAGTDQPAIAADRSDAIAGPAEVRERIAREHRLPGSVLFLPGAEPPLSPRWLAFWPGYRPAVRESLQGLPASGGTAPAEGHHGREFERDFARFANCEHALGVVDFPTALAIALSGLGIGQETGERHEVIVSGLASCALILNLENAGALPVFADVDPVTRQLTAETVSSRLTPQTQAVLVTHEAGMPGDMDGLMALAAQRGLRVIEDCSQAAGARDKGRSVGSLGHVACWSLGQDSILATGDESGAMLTTRDPALHERMDRLRGERAESRLSEIRAAIARFQLGRLPSWQVARQVHSERLWQVARSCRALQVPSTPLYVTHAASLATVFVDTERLKTGWDRDRILTEIVARGVYCYSQPGMGPTLRGVSTALVESLPVAFQVAATRLMFPCHPTMTEAEITRMCTVLTEVMAECTERRITSYRLLTEAEKAKATKASPEPQLYAPDTP